MTEHGRAGERRPRILLVEDEPGLRDALAMLLELDGYQVECASNGRAALDMLTDGCPDLVITDYMMPHLDGVSLIGEIRSDHPCAETPILLMSAVDLPEAVPADGGAQAFLLKPVSLADLRALLPGLVQGSAP